MKNSFLALLFLLIFSCSSDKATTEASKGSTSDTLTVQSDSSQTETNEGEVPEMTADLNEIVKMCRRDYELPLEIDSAGMDDIVASCTLKLSSDQVSLLSRRLLEIGYTKEVGRWLTELYTIEKLKAQGKYDAYVGSLDIAQIKDIVASTGAKIVLNKHSYIVFWHIHYNSYEACPYFSGELLLATLIQKNEITGCALLAESSGGGDAPYWGHTRITSLLSKDGFRSLRKDQSGGDEDEAGNEIVEESESNSEVRIAEEGFVFVK